MRYWVWWNDLIQGPFELDELISLHAFSESLLVCMDGREEWVPAGRVADLVPAIEQLKFSRAQPVSPPPHPPSCPPAATPLQGEFFGDAPGQQPLLESEDGPEGSLRIQAVNGRTGISPVLFSGQATMPFHFSQSPSVGLAGGGSTVKALDRGAAPQPFFMPLLRLKPKAKPKRIEIIAPPVIKESPVPKETLPEPFALEVLHEAPSQAPSLDEPFEPERKLEWLPWIMGVALAITALGSTGYWLMDRASTHSAIAEANRLEPPAPMSLPATTPLPVPKVDIRVRTIPANVVRPVQLHQSAKRSFMFFGPEKNLHSDQDSEKRRCEPEKFLSPLAS